MLIYYKLKHDVNHPMKHVRKPVMGHKIAAVRATPLAAALLASAISLAMLPLFIFASLLF
jgi:hypothetical protein